MGEQENFETYTQLKDKIKSKMDVGKFFAGFISLVLGIVLNDIGSLLENSSDLEHFIVLLGLLLLFFSLGMSVATLFAYDRLLMPPKLWYKPPNDNYYENEKVLENLKEDMINAWNHFFYPLGFGSFRWSDLFDCGRD